jgi:sporulation protein YlmC with PRC-barrel domain
MANREFHIELMLGRKVFDSNNELIGRLEEAVAVKQGDEWVVEEFWVGSGALLHRLSARGAGRAMLCLFGAKETEAYKVPWDKIDLSHQKRLRVSCARHELERLTVGEKTSRQRKRKSKRQSE